MRATLITTRTINATVRPDGTGRLVGVAPITLSNQTGNAGATVVAELNDVAVIELVSGSTMIYNVGTGKYEIRKATDVELFNIDYGTF